ncbi:IclR family transcriptional regulator [Arthrobacter sp. Sa2CUA1]|uniref:IclR family transcriptional regulator n=1 Tax=Arthrobacter gallicola TaxID=2762225 RepID=A0ABR8UTT5_9MICC|nr:IclR family transcriptional regulator [Arthrobacter gallicola]MBD7995962.1 IclR family transcriptional regulator [Arthrobacter gallicola]
MSETTAGAKTLERGLALLDHVAEGAETLEDLTRVSGLSRSAVHRMLTSLVQARYLSVDAQHRYHLGLKLLQLGAHAESSINLSAEISQILESISRETSDTTHLGILVESDVLYLAKARGYRGIEMASRPGAKLRAQNTAMGKVLLAQRTNAEALAAFDPAFTPTPRSITTQEHFLAALDQARRDGYALDDQENELGITCVAIGLPDLAGDITAAASISAPSVHMTPERIGELVSLMQARRPELTRCLPQGFERAWI